MQMDSFQEDPYPEFNPLIAFYEWIWVRTLNVERRRRRIDVKQILSQFNNEFLHSMFSEKKKLICT